MITRSSNSIHLAVAFDKNFLTPFYVLVTSIFANNTDNFVCIHAIVSGISDQEKEKLKSYIQANQGDIFFYSLTEQQVDSLRQAITDPKYTLATFYRLFIPILLPDTIERIIYIDTDIVVINDLAELYQMQFEEPFAAVVDPAPTIRTDLGITRPGNYFNAGVLLINLQAWRREKISEKALDFVIQFPEKCKYVDQCALNAVSIGNWKKIDSRYNLMGQYAPDLLKNEYAQFLDDKVIVHFNIFKPWDRLCQMRLRFLYHHYFDMSPEKGKKRYKKFNFTFKNVARLVRNKTMGIYRDHLAINHTYERIKPAENLLREQQLSPH
jgi:lipopolysaccharide biosynthesis glycosyltransferase